MNKILLIWDDDSSLKVYLLHVDKEKLEKIKKCHNKFIGSNENEELLWLYEWLESKFDCLVYEANLDRTINFDFPVISESTLVVCGFVE